VKYQHGVVLSLHAGPVVRLTGKEGKILSEIAMKDAVPGEPRVVETLDFALSADGRLAVSFFAQYRLGESSRGVLVWGLKDGAKTPVLVPLPDYACSTIGSEPAGGFWCLGGPARKESARTPTLLHRLGGGTVAPLDAVGAKDIRLTPDEGGEVHDPSRAGRLGFPAVMDGGPNRVLAWLPNASALVEVRAGEDRAEVRTFQIGNPWRGRAVITMAGSGPKVFALLPLRFEGEEESLTTAYALFTRNADNTGWRLLRSAGTFDRGSKLAGVEGESAVVWNRATRRLEWYAEP
jgi:hypothetical protein